MKLGIVVLLLVVVGCSGGSVPTVPASPVAPTPTAKSALLWVMVIEDSGACIEGATIQIIGAQGAGERMPQKTPCNMWDIDGGLLLKDLTPPRRSRSSQHDKRALHAMAFGFTHLLKPAPQVLTAEINRATDSRIIRIHTYARPNCL